MRLSSDSREFIELLNSRGVEYLIVGAYSLAFHGKPRFTGDLDLYIRPTLENAEKLIAGLRDFGFEQFQSSDFTELGHVIQLGRAPNRIDLLTSITGVSEIEAFAKKIGGELDGLPVNFLGRESLIANKRSMARPRDIADLADLEEDAKS